jgi:hypothetical protein
MMVMLLLEILLLLLLTICIVLLSPAIPLSEWLLILIVIRLAEIDLWLMIEVELLSLAFITLDRLFRKATCAFRVSVVPDHLLLALSHLEQWVDVEALRVLHHE